MDNFKLLEELIAEGGRVLATKREPPPGVIGDFRVDAKLALPWVAKAQLLLDNMLGTTDHKCKEFTKYSGKGYVSLGMAENAIKLLKEVKDSYGPEMLRFKKQLSDNVTTNAPQAVSKTRPDTQLTDNIFPSITGWDMVRIIFARGSNHDATIKLRGHDKKWHIDFRKMGCENTKTHGPDKQWLMLQHLAEGNGRLVWGQKHASPMLKKTKQLLSGKLRKYFKLLEDPFYDYKKVKAYMTKFELKVAGDSHCENEFSDLSEPPPARKRTAYNPEEDDDFS